MTKKKTKNETNAEWGRMYIPSQKLSIHYRNEEVEDLYKGSVEQFNPEEGFDLVATQDYTLSPGGSAKVDLGVVLKAPEGYRILIMPRSSTYNNNMVIQTNSIGVIDPSFCGENDFLSMQVLATNSYTTIKKGSRICQAILQPIVKISGIKKFKPGKESRGGYGTTGV